MRYSRIMWCEYAPLAVLSLSLSLSVCLSVSLSLYMYIKAHNEYVLCHTSCRTMFDNITKTCLYNVDPLIPHFYLVNLRFTGVYIFLFLLKNIDCGYSLEPSRRGGSNEYPQSMFSAEIWKISEFFYLKIFHFLVVDFPVYLNMHVFVMMFQKL